MNERHFLKRMAAGSLMKIWVILLVTGLVSCDAQNHKFFILSSVQKSASVYVLPGEPEYVHLAVKDLCSDVKKITGNDLSLITNPDHAGDYCLVVGSVDKIRKANHFSFANDLDNLKEKWEAYKIKNYRENRHYLLICGSDSRGTMFGIYDFIETYLGIDPMYFWSDLEPERKEKLAWSSINITQEEPTFKYRGWFINDEDLLTEWCESNGKRDLDYPFYHQVVHPGVMEHVVEALVRLRMNLIIPASFIDIRNPPEAELVKVAAKRGVFLSMHHIEPMGVSAFTFFNYWKDKTGEKPLFSFYSNKEKVEEVWRVYAKEWSIYPNVIWQIGLRGVADRPMWTADPGVPQTSGERGRIISEAMELQMQIIRELDDRSDPPVTTTLWMEGSALNKEGFLNVPEDVTIVFSDNCPGWKWQDDFYQTDRLPRNQYGVYYHHQLWGSGPHLAQGISPRQTHQVLREAIFNNTTEYSILNVSNIREFQLGLASSAHMLYDYETYDPLSFQTEWFGKRYKKHATEAEKLYTGYFDGFVLHDRQQVPMLLDGQIKSFAVRILRKINLKITDPEKYGIEEEKIKQNSGANSAETNTLAINDAHPQPKDQKELLSKVSQQWRSHFETLEEVQRLLPIMDDQSRRLLETNFANQLMIMVGLEDWLLSVIRAKSSLDEGNEQKCLIFLVQAADAFVRIKEGQKLCTASEKWQNWYRGEKKMNLSAEEEEIQESIQLIKKEIKKW